MSFCYGLFASNPAPPPFVAERYSQCSMEEDACGWSLGESVDGRYTIGRGQANSAPGPPVDAAPGTTHG